MAHPNQAPDASFEIIISSDLHEMCTDVAKQTAISLDEFAGQAIGRLFDPANARLLERVRGRRDQHLSTAKPVAMLVPASLEQKDQIYALASSLNTDVHALGRFAVLEESKAVINAGPSVIAEAMRQEARDAVAQMRRRPHQNGTYHRKRR